MKFELQALPYDKDALKDFVGPQTVTIHHEKHHGGYVKKLDAALADDARREQSLESLVLSSSGKIFNLAAQIWNHDFYWQSLTPQSSALGAGDLLSQIEASFGSVEQFSEDFSKVAAGEFGSGWAWLVYTPADKRKKSDPTLSVVSTSDAGNPMLAGSVPLVTLDVWEHAYYLDYQNERGRYTKAFLEHHINWEFAEANLKAAQ